MFNGHEEERRLDLSDPWYKNVGIVSAVWFFIILAAGMVIIALV